MAIFDLLKEELTSYMREGDDEINGNPQGLVQAMLDNAPDQKEEIGILLKYAANTNTQYNIWDAALAYFESEVKNATEDEYSEEEPTDEPIDEEPIDGEEGAGDELEDVDTIDSEDELPDEDTHKRNPDDIVQSGDDADLEM